MRIRHGPATVTGKCARRHAALVKHPACGRDGMAPGDCPGVRNLPPAKAQEALVERGRLHASVYLP